MEIKDLIITPIYLIIFLVFAYFARPYLTNAATRKYFIPALLIRFFGAIAVGLIYQFYYGGGDTFNYYDQASIIYEAFSNDFRIGLKLLFYPQHHFNETFEYASQIYWFFAREYFLIRIVGFLSIFCFNTYSTIALFFAFFSFLGSWLMFSVVQSKFPTITKWIALGVLFIPTVVFWGSGILKDTVSLGALGCAFWAAFQLIEKKNYGVGNVIILLFGLWLIKSIKLYILLTFLPALFIWFYLVNIKRVKNKMTRSLIAPVFIFVVGICGYFAIELISKESERYNLGAIAKWTYITSYDIRYWTGKDAGSGYDIGEQDGTWPTLIKLAPAAVNVSLFRPYLWEVKNPLMLLSALEALFFLIITLMALPRFKINNLKHPMVFSCLLFAILFAFAVGVSTYNFGSLNRYKIPLIPFYLTALFIMLKSPITLDKSAYKP